MMVNRSSRLRYSQARKNISPGKPIGSMAEPAEDLGVDVFLRRASVTLPVQTVNR
jgi:hypothetical protein